VGFKVRPNVNNSFHDQRDRRARNGTKAEGAVRTSHQQCAVNLNGGRGAVGVDTAVRRDVALIRSVSVSPALMCKLAAGAGAVESIPAHTPVPELPGR